MITVENELLLREMVCSDCVKAVDRVTAAKLLYEKGKFLDELRDNLSLIIKSDNTANAVKVKAIALLDKVSDDLMQTQANVSASEEAEIRSELMRHYVGNPFTENSPQIRP